MFIDDVTSSGAMPVLEASLRFASQRLRLIAGNIANISTPDYRQKDVSVSGFRSELARAIDARRSGSGGGRGELGLRSTRELRVHGPGSSSFDLTPRTTSGNVLFHDRNNRDTEGLIQDLVETTQAHRVSAELMRGRLETIRSAIAQRA